MKITEVRHFKLVGPPPFDPKTFWEERLVRPVDIYPEWRVRGPDFPPLSEPFYQNFLEIATDDGVSGIYGPIADNVLQIVLNNLRPYLIGQDPFATEKLWDLMYRSQVHGRKGETMFAISAVDIALWDLKGKAVNQPVVRLLGGPTRERIPAYASTLGRSLEPDSVSKACREYAEEGYTAMKWFFRHGPGSGPTGVEKNLELVKTLREAVGFSMDLMLDCWMGWSVPYTLKMARLLERYEPRWLEEPLLPDDIDGYAELNRRSPIPIAGGEHEYTRWGVKELLRRRAVSVLQVDVQWCGGISEAMKICAMASAEDVPVIPHAGWTEPSLCVIFSQPEPVCPIVEYLVKWGVLQQHFLGRHKPIGGYYPAPRLPGVGYTPDMDRAVR
jgi:L-alanine-DL-glutamate epimerase-like enolase superfamily enzyme